MGTLIASMDESRLRTIEMDAAPLVEVELGRGAENDPRVRRYLEALPPRAALELVEEVRELRRALDAAVVALAGAGYTPEAYRSLSETDRASHAWSSARIVWDARNAGPQYVMRFSRGTRHDSRSFPTREAALAAAIEVLETGEGYPDGIEWEGIRVIEFTEILRQWVERHDPG